MNHDADIKRASKNTITEQSQADRTLIDLILRFQNINYEKTP